MINYESIIQNPLYIRWVFNSTPELDLYWEDYLEKHPNEEHHLLELKTKLRGIKLVNESLSEAEKLKMAYEISKKLDKEDLKIKHRKRFIYFTKYAAVAVLFFAIGAIAVYLKMEKRDLGINVSEMERSVPVNGPFLIMPEGNTIPLSNGESTLDYTTPGELILNKDSVIRTGEPSKLSRLVMPHGSSSKIVLSDSTVVWLNAGSNLIYPSNFTGKTREVVLFGEAFFDVKNDKNRPFLVQTSALEIKVLGTKFNISAYPEDNIIQTVLKEGKVSIREIGTDKIEKEIILVPNQLASFDKKTKLTEIKNVNTDFYTSWTDGLLSFENRDLNRVIKSLERYYDINIQFENAMLGMVKISGKLDLKQNRNEVFEYLEKVSSTKFEKLDKRNYKIR